MSLVPCPDCHRHIRVAERACPFCGASIASSISSKVIPGATQRLSRAAAFAFTATLSLAGCSDPVTPAPAPAPDVTGDTASPDVTPDTSSPDVPAADRPVTQDTGVDAPNDMGGPFPAYGAPFDGGFPDVSGPDASPDDSGPGPGDGGIAPLYGAVPPPDASMNDATVRDGGGIVPLYGALPPPDAGDDVDASRDGSIGVRYGGPVRPDSGM